MRAAIVLGCSVAGCTTLLGIAGDYNESAPADASSSDSASEAPPQDASTDADADAPTSDATADVTLDAPPFAGCSAPHLFCEDFERDLKGWVSTAMNGTIAIDTAHVHSGSRALHGHLDVAAAPEAFLNRNQSLPSQFYVRFFIYVPSPLAPSPAVNILDLVEPVSPYQGIAIYLDKGSVGYVNYFGDASLNVGGMSPFPLDRWACVEWEIDVAGGAMQVSLDGVAIASDKGETMRPLGKLLPGVSIFQAMPSAPIDAWIDDFAVDGTRIGCN